MTNLEQLLARVREATGPDGKLDKQVMVALGGWCTHKNSERSGYQSDMGFDCLDCGADSWGAKNKNQPAQSYFTDFPKVTSSIDACLALMGEVLPGWWISSFNNSPPETGIMIETGDSGVPGYAVPTAWAESVAATPPLALLDCILQALIAAKVEV